MMAKARTSRPWGIAVIAASFWCIFIGQSAGAAEQTGRVIGWGKEVVGADLDGGFIAVSTGSYHSQGINQDRSVAAWGSD